MRKGNVPVPPSKKRVFPRPVMERGRKAMGSAVDAMMTSTMLRFIYLVSREYNRRVSPEL